MTGFDDSDFQSDDIGRIGESAVQQFFHRWRWLPRKDVDDQGVDFSVEIPRAPDGVRRRFLVQVKTANPVIALQSGDWSVPVKQGALRKYRDTREPVLLLAYDLPSQTIRCIHAQRWIKDSGHPLDGPKDSEVSIRFGIDSEVTPEGKPEFYDKVISAWLYQDAKHHPAPVAISQIEDELSGLDARFSLEVTASKHGYQYVIQAASDPVDAAVTLRPSTSEDAEGFHNAVKFGSAAKLNVDDFRMEGSPLFDRMPRGPALLELGAQTELVTVRLGRIRVKKPRNTLQNLIEVSAELTKGTHGAEVRVSDERLPLRFSFRSDFVDKKAHANFAFLPERLVGLPLTALGVGRIHEMLRAGSEGTLGLQILFRDQPSPGPTPLRRGHGDSDEWSTLADQVALALGLEAAAKRGRSIHRFGPVEDITSADEESWHTSWRLFHEGAARIPSRAINVNVSEQKILFGADVSNSFFVLRGAEYEVTGWGHVVARLPVFIEFHGYFARRTGEHAAAIEAGPEAKTVMRLQTKADTLRFQNRVAEGKRKK